MKKLIVLVSAIIGVSGLVLAANTTTVISGAGNIVKQVSSSGTSSLQLSGSSTLDNKNNITKLIKQKWYIKGNAYSSTMTYYEMHLQIQGTSTASTLSLETFGGGVIGSQTIPIQNGNFNQDVVIAFRMLQNSTVWNKYQTAVNLTITYPNGQVVVMPIKSPELRYGQTINSAPATNSIAAPHGINSLPTSNN
ncbi:MAG: hypothetical protein NTX05_07300 [Fusobacteria bacterium]|nr:hypothetical protein [Fusobacteriota bacterium]